MFPFLSPTPSPFPRPRLSLLPTSNLKMLFFFDGLQRLRVVQSWSMRLQLRDVPDDLHKDLKRLAIDEDTTLNALCITILQEGVKKLRGAAHKESRK